MKMFVRQATLTVHTAVVLTLVIVVMPSVCGASSEPSSRGETARGSVQAAAAAIPTTTTLPSGAVVPSTDVAACRGTSLQFQFIQNDSYAAAGSTISYLQIANVGGMPCSLKGYPKVSGLNSAGQPVAQADDTQCGFCWDIPYYKPPIVVLSPGEAAYVKIFGSDVNFPDCPVYNALSLTLPDDDVATVVSTPGGFAECGGSFAVGYIRPTQRPVVDPAHVTPCRAAALQVLGGGWWNAQAGTAVTDLNIENVGPVPCSLHGYPKVLGLNSAGVAVAQALERDSMGPYVSDIPYSKPPFVVLAYGEWAVVTLFGSDHNFPRLPAVGFTPLCRSPFPAMTSPR